MVYDTHPALQAVLIYLLMQICFIRVYTADAMADPTASQDCELLLRGMPSAPPTHPLPLPN